MIGFLKKMLGMGPKADFEALIQAGAVIVDVRTPGEFAQGHLKRSRNIPLDKLGGKMDSLKGKGAIITVCASGMRSGSAKRMLEGAGFTEVYNGGPWQNLRAYDKK